MRNGIPLYQWWQNFRTDIEKCNGKSTRKDGAGEAERAAESSRERAGERYCGLSWETEYGETDEAELPVIEY